MSVISLDWSYGVRLVSTDDGEGTVFCILQYLALGSGSLSVGQWTRYSILLFDSHPFPGILDDKKVIT